MYTSTPSPYVVTEPLDRSCVLQDEFSAEGRKEHFENIYQLFVQQLETLHSNKPLSEYEAEELTNIFNVLLHAKRSLDDIS